MGKLHTPWGRPSPNPGQPPPEQTETASIVMLDTNIKPTAACVAQGYGGVEQDNQEFGIKRQGKMSMLNAQKIKLSTRRHAVEFIRGQLKGDRRLERCHLKGEEGDRFHAVLCAARYDIRWSLRIVAKKGLRAFLRNRTDCKCGGWTLVEMNLLCLNTGTKQPVLGLC